MSAVWGACALCPDSQAAPPARHSCCDPHGTSSSAPSSNKPCPRHSLAAAAYDNVEAGSLQSAQAPVSITAVLAVVEIPASVHTQLSVDIAPVVHAPPDLCLYNSVLLI